MCLHVRACLRWAHACVRAWVVDMLPRQLLKVSVMLLSYATQQAVIVYAVYGVHVVGCGIAGSLGVIIFFPSLLVAGLLPLANAGALMQACHCVQALLFEAAGVSLELPNLGTLHPGW